MQTDVKIKINQLPNDVNALQDLVRSLQEKNETLQTKCQWYLEQFKLARHQRFSRQSEKNTRQMDLFDEAGIEPETEKPPSVTVKSHQRHPNKRKPLPADLPREIITVDVALSEKQCPCCQKERPCIGEEITEKLDIIPMQMKVVRYVRPKYGHCCTHDGIVIAKQPRLFLPKSIAAPGLASHLIVSKYEDHLPLYRQSNSWKRQGIDFPRSSMCRAILKSAEYCQPLLDLLQRDLLTGDYLHADETPVQVMHESDKKNTSKSYNVVLQ